jgi:parallel beta-helix repeat protein
MIFMNRIFNNTATAAIIALTILPASAAYAIHYSGPIYVDANYVKKHGNVITGNYQGTTTLPAVTISNATGSIVVANCNLTGPGDMIYIVNSNVSVTGTTAVGSNPNIAGTAKGMFVHAINPVNLSVTNNNVSDVSYGVYVSGYSGNYAVGQTISILNNKFSNIDGRPSNGSGGYVTTGSYNAHGIQLNNIHGLAHMVVAWNEIDNVPFQSQSAEVIETIDVSGICASHLAIHDNYVQGAYPADPGVDAYSGGGILINGTATDTATTASAFTDILNNQVVSTANVGIAIAAGHDNTVSGNRVVSSGYVATGTTKLIAFSSAIGMYNWNYYNQAVTVFFNNMITNNVVGLIRKSSTGVPQRADTWLPGQTGGTNTSFLPYTSTSPTLANETTEYQTWLQKLANQNQLVGHS